MSNNQDINKLQKQRTKKVKASKTAMNNEAKMLKALEQQHKELKTLAGAINLYSTSQPFRTEVQDIIYQHPIAGQFSHFEKLLGDKVIHSAVPGFDRLPRGD
jgi:hypothetical protein